MADEHNSANYVISSSNAPKNPFEMFQSSSAHGDYASLRPAEVLARARMDPKTGRIRGL